MLEANILDSLETLRNGLVVRVRAIRPGDKAGISAAFSRLGAQAIYTRFFHAKQSLTEEELEAATEVDGKNVVALLVTIAREGEEIIIGGGRYMTLAAPSHRSAEIAFLVQEGYQGLGIAGRLLQHLARLGLENGVSRFEADVLPHNRAMLAVFSRSGFRMQQTLAEEVVHVTLFIEPSTITLQES